VRIGRVRASRKNIDWPTPAAWPIVVGALPGEVTRIRVELGKPVRYVWHCHILSHKDHEMLRVLQVVP
jgi:FtsP/CotA-like multicopper oxidase with cupredoxin domain